MLLNIFHNSVEAMPEGGVLKVKTEVDGPMLRVIAEDTGCGMAEEVRQRVFSPFFTTKQTVGAGLGLLFGNGSESTPWWPALAITAASVSLVAIVPWARVVPSGAWAGALFDLLILAALLPPWSDQIVTALR